MSRALDKEVIAALRQTDPNVAYTAVSGALTVHGDELLEIEILGRSHPLPAGQHVVQEHNAVGVSKLALVQAFLVARQVLKRAQDGEDVEADDIRAATAVILLMDPEHLTAANTRKRLISSAPPSGPGTALEALLLAEKRLTDSLLTSPLHRHSKSPTLWAHRRWLLQTARSSGIYLDDVPTDIANVVLVSAQRHPRNYYAWTHARWLVGILDDDLYRDGREIAAEENRILEDVKRWCLKHHTDISGWTFLYFLLVARDSSLRRHCSDIFAETMRLAVSLRWANETIWVFLRTLVVSAGNMSSVELEAFMRSIAELKTMVPGDSEALEVLDRARSWAETARADLPHRKPACRIGK